MTNQICVSIIIPFYNAEKYLLETIQSVYQQTYSHYEVIFINDGSTDNSEQIVKKEIRKEDKYISKPNTGISDSRNKGLQSSKGEYLLFLDSDDLLAEDFLEKRVRLFEENPDFDFCCSNVVKIDQEGNKINGIFRGIYNNINEEVLLYSQNVLTCPSNYLIKKRIMINNKLYFNTNLSSSADRFFLIELSKYAQGGYISKGGELFYRVHAGSMSNNLNKILIKDNLMYLHELNKYNYVPPQLKKQFLYKINFILAGSNYKLKNYINFIRHALIAVYYNPKAFLSKLLLNK